MKNLKFLLISILICLLIAVPVFANGGIGIEPVAQTSPPMPRSCRANIENMIKIMDLLGFKTKAKQATKMLTSQPRKIFVKDIKDYGTCNLITGSITLDINSVCSWMAVPGRRDILISENEPFRERLTGEVISASAILYHEMVHCFQQSRIRRISSSSAYRLTAGDHVTEMEAHGKDIQFTNGLINRLDEIYKKIFGEDITPQQRIKIRKILANDIKESYVKYYKGEYEKPAWAKRIVNMTIFGGWGFWVGEKQEERKKNFEKGVNTGVKKAEEILGEKIIYVSLPEPKNKTITKIDVDLKFLSPKDDHYIFTSVDWFADLAKIYNNMESSAFQGLLERSFGEHTNVTFVYEDGGKVIVGLDVKKGEIINVYSDALKDPDVDITIPRLTVADLMNSDSFYKAFLNAHLSGKIQVKYNTWWGKTKNFFYKKTILPFRKKAIIKTDTNEILTTEFLKSKEVVLNDKEEIVDFTKPTTSKTENIKKVEVPKKVSIPKKTIAPKKTTAPKKVTEVKKAETKTVPEQKNVETPKKTPEPKTPPLPKATCGDGKVNQTSEQCDPPGKQAQCYTGEKCNNKCLCEYQEEVAVCGDGKITYPEICDGSKFNQQCTNSINDYKKMNPSLVSRCFNNCRGCEAAAP